MKMSKKILLVVLVIIAVFLSGLVGNTVINTSKYQKKITDQLACYESSALADINSEKAVSDLSKALQYETIYSYDKSKVNESEFIKMHNFLDSEFPNIRNKLSKEIINKYSLLYKWEGEDDSEAIILLAHMDVVGGNEKTDADWNEPIFSGAVTDEYIYGRGALDIKGQLISIFESVDQLVKEGYVPKKTVYIAVGHDEELGGNEGNKEIVKRIQKEGKKINAVLDEGGYIVKGIVPKVDKPVALVGVAEKGSVTLKISGNGKGGHSSMPENNTAISTVSSAVAKLKKSPFKKEIISVTGEFLDNTAPMMPFISRLGIYNRGIFKPIITNMLSDSGSTNALITTTIAPTIIHGGEEYNVIPDNCEVVINFRILPGESVDSVKDQVSEYLKSENVTVELYGSYWNSSKISDYNNESYKILQKTINKNFEDTMVAPYLVVGCTDSRYYQDICDNIYRFTPLVLEKDDLQRIHGVNERLSKDGYIKMIDFYYDLIKSMQ